ncbi:DUF3152 domain-containing protein [Saccharothrix syringae]|uniref:DUF3152 domain-containing protein n=1 Tax=Saccharothrix syringae TaxID=103733 RepID=A0A5Q0GRU8_SACSY|nr:DUF3152 domain-containing protein [Saccharothrix syringae]QFZ16816.1 DUF3152 domain-containing protein [Saccharothrix syringae]
MNRTTQGAPPPSGVPSGDRPPLSEDRYRRGGRRTAGEPLAASWEPAGRRPRRRRRGVRGLVANYGWRIYAVPVLLVLTALVVLDTATPPNGGAGEADGPRDGDRVAASTPAAPSASEKPPVEIDLKNFPTAVLPDGPRYSEQGAGTYQVVPGATERAGGGGRLYRYNIAIEDGVEPVDYGGDREAFARTVDSFLADPRSWVGAGQVSMQRVEGDDVDFTVSLSTTGTTHALCGFSIQFESSCWHPPSGRVVINVARWVRGAKAYGNDIVAYRTYAINHEVGHVLGIQHEGCKENGRPAPVMMQQSFGVANDYVAQLNTVDASNRNAVPADGKVCTPNPFPVAPQ